MKSTHPKEIEEVPSIKIGTKREALWTDVKKATMERIENLNKNLEIDKELLELAEKIIAEEEEKK